MVELENFKERKKNAIKILEKILNKKKKKKVEKYF
jgi:hypothetical protein